MRGKRGTAREGKTRLNGKVKDIRRRKGAKVKRGKGLGRKNGAGREGRVEKGRAGLQKKKELEC